MRAARDKSKPSWRSDPATDAQKEYLRSLGVEHPSTITKGEASDLIEAGKEIRDHQPPTEGQIRRLSFYGLPVPPTKDIASAMIDEWRDQFPEQEAEYQASKIPAQKSGSSFVWLVLIAALIAGMYFLLSK